jgi:hypothetical protein
MSTSPLEDLEIVARLRQRMADGIARRGPHLTVRTVFRIFLVEVWVHVPSPLTLVRAHELLARDGFGTDG